DGIRDDLVTGVQTCALPICGELREYRIAAIQQPRCALDVGTIGAPFVREHRVVVQSELLRALHLGIPIGAFHETYGNGCSAAREIRRASCRARVEGSRAVLA